MTVHKYEVVKEYVYFVPGLNEMVKARIIKSSITNGVIWECSHCYQDAGGKKAYESNHESDSVEWCESELDSYMSKFNADTAKINSEY